MKFIIKSAKFTTFLMCLTLIAVSFAGPVIAGHPGEYEAQFAEDGQLIRPAGWREWVFVGSPLTPNSMNGGAAPFPEFHTVYIDPKSWAHYKRPANSARERCLPKS
jgi:hypothetical protein